MHSALRLALALSALALFAPACSRSAKPASETPRSPASTSTSTAKVTAQSHATADAASAGTAPSAQTALSPEGWLIVSDEEWIPVLHDAGRALAGLEDSYRRGDTLAAALRAHAAADAMRREERLQDPDERARLEATADKLDALGLELELNKPVSREELTSTLQEAARAAALLTWIHFKEESVVPLLESPRAHFDRASDLLNQQRSREAADEIRRGAAYFRLAAQGARPVDRRLLEEQVAALAETAAQADRGDLTVDALHHALARVDAAYALAFLHEAEDNYREERFSATSFALRETAQRMRARMHWLETQALAASGTILDDVENAASELDRGVTIAKDKMTALFERARQHLQQAGAGHTHG